ARSGARAVLVAGELLLVAGLALLLRPPTGHYLVDVLPSMLVLGGPAGLALPAVPTGRMSDPAPEDARLAGDLADASQQTGGGLSSAVLAGFAAARTDAALAAGATRVAALTGGDPLAFAASAVAVAALLAVTLTVLRR